MLLWVCFAILTVALVAYLLRPLRRAPGTGAVASEEADVAVYRDQLKELEAERERGLIAESELEGARAEVARRLIKRAGGAQDDAARTPARGGSGAAHRIYTAVAGLLPLAGVAVYLAIGSPHLPAHPFAARETAAPEAQKRVADLIKQVEARLKEHPEDGRGWDVIAPVYLRFGRFPEAAHAFAEANRLEGESERRLIGFAEATMMAESGAVTEPVRITARRILELDASAVQPRIWLALGREQDGDLAGAANAYRELLAAAPDDAPWRDAVAERLMLVEARIRGEDVDAKPASPPSSAAGSVTPDGEKPASSEVGGKTAADVAAMSPEEQDAFVMGMVNRLAARLEENGKDLEGWKRLARAYKVIGRDDDARAAIAEARTAFSGDEEALKEIAAAENALGLAAKEEKTAP